MYNDMPIYDERHDDVVWEGRRGDAYGEGVQRDRTGSAFGQDDFGRPGRSNTWKDDVYDRQEFTAPSRSNTFATGRGNNDDFGGATEKRVGPGRPTAPKPKFGADKEASLKQNEAIALFNFDADQPGDLGFKKGEIITVLKKTDSDNDWWYVETGPAPSGSNEVLTETLGPV
jgi:hypothetical protein